VRPPSAVEPRQARIVAALGRGAPRGLLPPMPSLARARAKGQPGHRHPAVGALRGVVLELAATSSVNTTARAQASCKAPSHQRHGGKPARRVARRQSASIPRPRDREARPRDRTRSCAVQTTAAGAPRRCPLRSATSQRRHAARRPRDEICRAVRSRHLGSGRDGHRGKHRQRAYAQPLPFAATPSGQRFPFSGDDREGERRPLEGASYVRLPKNSTLESDALLCCSARPIYLQRSAAQLLTDRC
jgi:hypothetical protein